MTWENATGLPQPTRGREGRDGTTADLLDAIEDGARIHIAYAAAFPVTLASAISEAQDQWTDVEIVTGVHHDAHPLFEPAKGSPFRFALIQASGPLGPALAAGAASVIPSALSDWPRICAPDGPRPCDVSLVQVSPPGPDGRFSMGTGAADQIEIVRRAPVVIAEVNPRMPYTFGATELFRDEIDLLIEAEHELPEAGGGGDFGELEATIAAHAAPEIPDGATLQFGIGRIPDAIVASLDGHSDLGLHSGMIGDACIGLVEAGVLTGARKSADVGKLVAGVVLGSRRIFDWVDRNPDVLMVPAAYSHGASTLASVHQLAAINSVIEVALDGSANAEQIGDRIISGPGGQPDYALGAQLSPGGVGIVAISSTAGRTPRSRIVDRLPASVPVSIPRNLADRVVTEYGVARLDGATLAERADRLRAIAHPDFREELTNGPA
ncbi:MAG: acetyl-CoA hydrolase/transferase C-terminal domain-containing protein [Actinomycetota bacterium]